MSKGQQVKRENMKKLLNLIENNKGVSYENLEALAGFLMGLSVRTFKTYMDQLEVLDKIKQTDGRYEVT